MFEFPNSQDHLGMGWATHIVYKLTPLTNVASSNYHTLVLVFNGQTSSNTPSLHLSIIFGHQEASIKKESDLHLPPHVGVTVKVLWCHCGFGAEVVLFPLWQDASEDVRLLALDITYRSMSNIVLLIINVKRMSIFIGDESLEESLHGTSQDEDENATIAAEQSLPPPGLGLNASLLPLRWVRVLDIHAG